MCGIVCFFSRKGQSVSEHALRRGMESLHHRGPDSRYHWISDDRRVGLGHTRLSIVGLGNGTQPLSSPDGSIQVVVNGEFYDHETIRAECEKRGYRFNTDSDSEILIPLYQQYGMECLDRLRGEFAFILWDKNRQTLFACRDRFGIKPLVYTEYRGAFYAASEAKALFAMGVEARWDEQTVADAEYIVREMTGTYFKGVKNVGAGCFLEITRNNIAECRYWDLAYPSQNDVPGGITAQDYIAGFKSLLSEAIQLRLRADVPVSCYLSGGLDSASILGLMREYIRAPIAAYTIAFNDKAYNEVDFAREMALFAGADHRVLPIGEADLALNFADALWHNESPIINGNGVAKFLLSRYVRDSGHKVVLTGEGADEVLAGYSFFREDLWRQQAKEADSEVDQRGLSRLHARNQVTAGLFSGGDPDADLSTLEATLGYIPTQLAASTVTGAKLRALRSGLFNTGRDGSALFANLLAALDVRQLTRWDVLNRSLYIHGKSVLPNYILTALGDRSEMAHGIEGRVPFLDHKLVEYLARIPPSLKINGTTEKYLLREAVRDNTTERLYRREKHPFIAPPAETAKPGPLTTLMADTFHGSELRDLPFYDQSKVIKLFEQASSDNPGTIDVTLDVTLTTVLSLCLMQKRFNLS